MEPQAPPPAGQADGLSESLIGVSPINERGDEAREELIVQPGEGFGSARDGAEEEVPLVSQPFGVSCVRKVWMARGDVGEEPELVAPVGHL